MKVIFCLSLIFTWALADFLLLNFLPASWFSEPAETPHPRLSLKPRFRAGTWFLFFIISNTLFLYEPPINIDPALLYKLAFTNILLLIGLSDALFFIIPDQFTLALAFLSLAKLFFLGFEAFKSALIRALILGLLPLLLAFFLAKIFKKEALGMGDLKLLAVFGISLSLSETLTVLNATLLLAFTFLIMERLVRGKSWQSPVPFGTCLTLAYIIKILF